MLIVFPIQTDKNDIRWSVTVIWYLTRSRVITRVANALRDVPSRDHNATCCVFLATQNAPLRSVLLTVVLGVASNLQVVW